MWLLHKIEGKITQVPHQNVWVIREIWHSKKVILSTQEAPSWLNEKSDMYH